MQNYFAAQSLYLPLPVLTLCPYFARVHFAPVFLNIPRMQKERFIYVTLWHNVCCKVLPYAKAVPKGGWGWNKFHTKICTPTLQNFFSFFWDPLKTAVKRSKNVVKKGYFWGSWQFFPKKFDTWRYRTKFLPMCQFF